MLPKELRHLLRVVVIAALCTLALARLEPVTQITFPDERAGQPLVGVGARELRKEVQSHLSWTSRLRGWTGWSREPDPELQMYAVGLYADRIGSQLALLKLKGEELVASELPPSFFEAICDGFAKTIVIKMACSVTREQVAGALVESVQQRLGHGGSKELEALQEIIHSGCVGWVPWAAAGRSHRARPAQTACCNADHIGHSAPLRLRPGCDEAQPHLQPQQMKTQAWGPSNRLLLTRQ
jgi:hypothetical protein